MMQHFVVRRGFDHQIECMYTDGPPIENVQLRKGDILTVTYERKFVDTLGWYSLIGINGHYQFYMSMKELKGIYQQGKICSALDLELQLIHHNFKLNEALDTNNREAFLEFSEQRREVQELLDAISSKA